MPESPTIGLHLTPESEETKIFREWRTEMSGDDENSNLMIIDSAFKDVQDKITEIDSTPITWGMLKNGLGNNTQSTP